MRDGCIPRNRSDFSFRPSESGHCGITVSFLKKISNKISKLVPHPKRKEKKWRLFSFNWLVVFSPSVRINNLVYCFILCTPQFVFFGCVNAVIWFPERIRMLLVTAFYYTIDYIYTHILLRRCTSKTGCYSYSRFLNFCIIDTLLLHSHRHYCGL